MTPEGKVKSDVRKLLNKYGAYTHMPVQNGMGAPSLDFVCCIKGIFLGIEAKAKPAKPTKRQLKTMEQMRKAGGVAIWVDEDRMPQLEQLLQKLKQLTIQMVANDE